EASDAPPAVEKVKSGRKRKAINLIKNKKLHEFSRKTMNSMRLTYARERFAKDFKYRWFHLYIAELFARQLIEDAAICETNPDKLSLCSKWAPNCRGSHFDRYTLLATSIALQLVRLQNEKEANNPNSE